MFKTAALLPLSPHPLAQLRQFFQKLHFEWELQGKLWHTCYTTYTTPVGARVKLLLFSFSKKSAVVAVAGGGV